MNTLRTVARLTAPGHELAVFRASTVAQYHSLSGLRQVSERNADSTTRGMMTLRDMLAGAPARDLLSSPGKAVRNRCMHYEIRDSRVSIDPYMPMFGIVEAIFPKKTLAEFSDEVASLIALVADLLGEWSPRSAQVTAKPMKWA